MSASVSLHRWLMDRGLTVQEADLWADFINDALELLDDGHALLRTPAEWASFLGGCAGPAPTEPELTSGLGDRMQRLRNDAPIDSSRDRIQVGYECPTPGDERHGNRKSKADFRFEKKFDAGFAAAFVVEAKPLRTPADIPNRYMAADGLGCFLERSPPYSRELAVGMLGYAYRNPAAWMPALTRHLGSAGSATRCADVALSRGRMAHASDHPRAALGLNPVTVLHTVLDFA
ncbi:hypothetical protein PQ455_13590 [Sphingomonas naphthae]|uniref:Restriction endonuclease n=1 Tax=Sphingomonas naphthae TaxID=1813468 RepID=A0ABY7TI81_9SPHN|nr:hypothetical protein [Sphingomonas naphthae]WCT72660.1 hypothetical protein PQ455_13590 [Sphingomonas naphthae]